LDYVEFRILTNLDSQFRKWIQYSKRISIWIVQGTNNIMARLGIHSSRVGMGTKYLNLKLKGSTVLITRVSTHNTYNMSWHS
jgi:hypothetical protein